MPRKSNKNIKANNSSTNPKPTIRDIDSISSSLFDFVPFINEVVIDRKRINDFNGLIDRYKAYDKLCSILDKDIKKAILMESGIFEFTIIYMTSNGLDDEYITSVYDSKLLELVNNIDPNSKTNNTYLKKNIMNGSINVQLVPLMNYTELNKPKWENIIEKIQLKEDKINNIATTDLYTCGKCKESKCTVVQMQTRGADEMTSNIVTCTVCGNGWVN